MTDQFNQKPSWQDHQFAEPAKGHPSTWAKEVEQLRAENERLRAALLVIASRTKLSDGSEYARGYNHGVWMGEKTARAALQEGKG